MVPTRVLQGFERGSPLPTWVDWSDYGTEPDAREISSGAEKTCRRNISVTECRQKVTQKTTALCRRTGMEAHLGRQVAK